MTRETLTSLTERQALAGRTAIVTGASGAFGSATLRVLRFLGARAVGLDVKPGDDVLACDVGDDEQVTAAVGEAVRRLGGRLDILIHYAGVGPAVDVGQPPGPQVHEALEVNLLGPWRVTAAAMPALLAGRTGGRAGARGRVVITASLLAGVTMPFTAAYTVSKRALTAYADVLRLEYGTHLEVTTVYPGYVDTPIHDRSRAAGVSLDGLVPAERIRDTVLTAISAAAADRPPRDVASTGPGTAARQLARHAPGLLDRAVAARVGRLARQETFSGAALAAGLRDRHLHREELPA
ncbi:MAG TPA: SDR family NAD(P)-dependent oxidoreductase [Streptosporangiaceae bacterium]|nr:SDR family NAD(P)-dependent oxidoreductase [Streptosporangiaceae bacterium]